MDIIYSIGNRVNYTIITVWWQVVVRLIMVIIFQCVKILNHHCTPETNNIVSQLHFSIKKPLTKNKHKYSHTTLHLWISLHLTKPFHIHHHIWAWPEPCKVVTSSKGTAKSLQSCPTLCDPRDGSPPGSTVPGILQARTLLWEVSIYKSNNSGILILAFLPIH